MIFLTVGTQFPFDRLVRAVDDIVEEGLITETVFGQVGQGGCRPRNFESVACLDKEAFDQFVRQASRMIGHAGMGTITVALNNHKPLLVLPRLKKYHEVVNDHQVAIARRLSELGHVLAVHDVEDLRDGVRRLETFVPKERKAAPHAVAERIQRFLDGLQD